MDAVTAARKCLGWMTSEEEREDRLGDLEELLRSTERKAGASVARRRYVQEAGAICVSILQRRMRRAITNGGVDMARILLWATASVAGVFLFLELGGGSILVYMQPFEWGVILAAMVGFAAAGNRLGAWPGILADLRRANHLGGPARLQRRAAFLRKPEPSADFAHLNGLLRVAQQAGSANLDQLMSGGIALFREKSIQRLRIVEQTARDAYAGAAIAGVFGLIHTLEYLEESVSTIGHLLSGALCASFFGMILSRAVVAPIASRLSVLYEQQMREMDALRLSLGGTGGAVAAEAFEVLASGLAPQA